MGGGGERVREDKRTEEQTQEEIDFLWNRNKKHGRGEESETERSVYWETFLMVSREQQ